ncbi:hypothetical protein HPB50_016725 [Hyalomma asiaticum]|uniref:Uncharacterized protein n=1 Tax=Hyalomma asiaticum TaxID=266040 RepID=A0ACB7TIX4_HYAAI|nr:hypothetical protein HPB50_016725 [Hyalomma asiaticum]
MAAALLKKKLQQLKLVLQQVVLQESDEDLVTTEELTTEELAASVSEKETISNDSALDPKGDDTSAPQPVTSGGAAADVAAVQMLPMYLSSEPNICAQLDNVEAAVMKCVIKKRKQGPSTTFFKSCK